MKKKQQNFNTPILLIIFNRPDFTAKIFESIRKIKPKFLYVAADGPRKNKVGEDEKCAFTRKITEQIDWKCKVYRLYRTKNLGCGVAVSSAIDWFFKNVNEGIILEDDCLPDPTFFSFVESMLKKYRNDDNIMHISGDNFLPQNKQRDNIYLLSKYPHIWGWGTWRRAWNKYDFKMTDWKRKGIISKFKSIDGSIFNKIFWISKFDSVGYKITNTWDYQWVYAMMREGAYSIVPGTNLVSNIGFGSNSTHTGNRNYNHAKLKTLAMKDNPPLGSKTLIAKLDEFELKDVFKTNRYMTPLYFVYFSIGGMIYNWLINFKSKLND